MLSKNIEIPVVRTNLEVDTLWAVPLIKHCLDGVPFSFQRESHRSFIRFMPGVRLYLEFHSTIIRQAGTFDLSRWPATEPSRPCARSGIARANAGTFLIVDGCGGHRSMPLQWCDRQTRR
jgi:hypothetical protein